MKVILLRDIPSVGKKYEIKDVSQGYAQNMLFPKNFAVQASESEISRINSLKARIESEKKEIITNIQNKFTQLQNKVVEVARKANEIGHLFAALHEKDIAIIVFGATKVQLEAQWIKITRPIKELGDHKISLEAEDQKANFILRIIK